MASQKSSSDEALSEESCSNELNLYDSDVGELSELSEHVEPHRVPQNVREEERELQSKEETRRLPNTDW